jgi:hypothetical protein
METLSYQEEVKANKEHRCDFCFDKIKKGETYCTSTHKQDGEVYTWKTHKYCSEIASRLKMYDDCDEGVTADDFQETIHSKYFDLMLGQFSQDDIKKYSIAIQEFRKVYFKNKLMYVIQHYARLDKNVGSNAV